MPEFVTVYSTHTGRPHRVPEHYLENPHLMKPFRRTPVPDAAGSEEPSTSWTLADLRTVAEKRGVDLAGAGRTKQAIVDRIAAAAHPTTIDPTVAFDQPDDDVDTGSSSGTESDDNSPAEG